MQGLCEGIIGRFRGQNVRFHGKLKRPVITKRSSVSASTGKLKYPNSNAGQSVSSSYANSLKAQDDNSSTGTLRLKEEGPPPESMLETPRSHDSPTCSLDPVAQLHDTSHLLVEPTPAVSSIVSPTVSPLNIVKKSPTASPHQTTFTQKEQSPDIHASAPSSISLEIPTTTPLQSPALTDNHDSDGETGIGLSLLQNIESTESDDESVSGGTSASQHEEQDDESTVEGLLYDGLTDDPNVSRPQTTTIAPQVSLSQGVLCANGSLSKMVLLPSQPSSPLSTTPPRSLASLSPPANYQHFSMPSPKPSLRSQRSQQSLSSWEGAGDIYDDYRYSRASMVTGGTATARGRRSSGASSKASPKEAWDGNGYDQPPPPIPVANHRPSIDSISATRSGEAVPLRRSAELKRSGELRKSDGSRKSAESQAHPEVRRSRQELLFPQPPSTVNVHHELLDQATRDSLRRTTEASRILTPADFRLSVGSEASIYSRMSVIEQEPHSTTESDTSSPPPISPGSPVKLKLEIDVSSKTQLRPTPLLLSEGQTPLLHTNWPTPTSSSCDQDVSLASATSPTFISTVLSSFTAGITSVLREKAENMKMFEELEKEQTQERDGSLDAGKNVRDAVVADEEDIPSDGIEETTFEHTHDSTLNTTQATILPTESVQAAVGGDTLIRTPSPVPLLENQSIHPRSLDDLLVHCQPSGVALPLRGRDIREPLSSTLPVSPASHSQPSCHPLTLADLRKGGGVPIPGTKQWRSLFLPHPNAPKSPPIETRGPLFIASQQHSLFRGHTSDFIVPEKMPKKRLLEVIYSAVHSPPSFALGSRMLSRGPTIYGECDVELGAALGPVPITFSVEPLPLPPSQHHVAPQPSDNQVLFASKPSSSVPPSPRSATSSPAFRGCLRRCESAVDGSGLNENVVVDGSGGSMNNEMTPRANFFPKGLDQRPRSRSYSALNSHSTKVEMLFPVR